MDMGELLNPEACSSKSVEEVWKEIVRGSSSSQQQLQQQQQEMNLEDLLGKGGSGGVRSKRRAMEEALVVVDKANLQKQRRMIKNRESAARSRERKQAYTVELESLVMQLEEENARLLREEADENKQRLKQLMECLIPVVEKRKPRRMLRRVNSVQW